MLIYILQGVAYGLGAAAQPGPFQTYLISQSLLRGPRRTLLAALAPLVSDGPVIAISLLVLTQVPPWLERALYTAGGLFVLYLSHRSFSSWRHFDASIRTHKTSAQRNILDAALINILNPNPYIYWALVAGPILLTGWRQMPIHGLAFIACFYLTMILSLAALILVFGSARGMGPKINRALLGASASALGVFGLYQIWRGLTG